MPLPAALTVLAAMLCASLPGGAAAQPAAPIAQVERQFDISAGPLAQALNAYATQAGVTLSFDARQVHGLSSAGLRGAYGVDAGFARLLQGSGLRAVSTGAGTYGLQPVPRESGNATELPVVEVSGASISGSFGDERGYIAADSISATKTVSSIRDTPASVSVVTRQQIDDQGAQTVSQALRYTAGVVPEARPGRYDYPNIRGFGSPGGADANFVGLMDGLRLPKGVYYIAPSIDPYMLDRVEILRGPASVLYGSVNPGGAINLVSKRPTVDPLHEIEVQYGSYDRKQVAADFGGALNESGTLSYRLTGVAHDAGTQIDHAKDERYSISPAITWAPDADTRFTVLGNYQHDPSAGAFSYLPARGTVHDSPWGRFSTRFSEDDPDVSRSDREQSSIGYEFEHRFNDTWTVRQNLRYMHARYNYRSVFQTGWAGDQPLLDRMTIGSRESLDGIALDNQAQVKFDTGAVKHTALVGLDYRHNRADARLGYGEAPALNVLDPVYGLPIADPPYDNYSKQTLRQLGLYAQDQVRWGKWVGLFGLRHDWVDADTVSSVVGSGVTTRSPQKDEATSWRAGLVYLFDNGLAPYLNYSTSFEPVLGTDFHGQPFKPTKGKQYEAGVKYQPQGLRSSVTASVFQITQANVKTADPDPTHPYASIQTGEVRSRGLELEGKLAITDQLSVLASYTLLDTRNTRSTTAQDKWPYGVPRQMASGWVDYTVAEGPLAGVGMGAGVRYVGDSYGNADNTLKVSSYTLVDAALRYDLQRLDPRLKGAQVAVNVSNLFDRKFVASCWDDNSCFYGPRRNVIATLRYRW
ncbi:TonB-dependent siderophore receptor [Achromobacter aloeverae]|nr:TonB-dependent siderophore receptor [Achromobacter aloeverae]